jgi:hypothetical protein
MGIESQTQIEAERQLLRHSVATLAYRGGKTLRGAPEGFSGFRASETTRTPGQVLAHIGDLLDWALSISQGKQEWLNSNPQSWEFDSQRFFAALAAFDSYLASGEPLGASVEKLFQGPIADAFTHVGQIAILRRMAEAPVRAENYFRAEIVAGRVGPNQAAPKREFD